MLRLWVQTGDDEYVLCLSERRWHAGTWVQLTSRGTITALTGWHPIGVVAPDSMQRPMSPNRYGPSKPAVERRVAWMAGSW